MGPGFRLDLHVHSQHSRDARGSVLELARAARQVGLHGFALTDHDSVAGHAEIAEAAEVTGMLIVPGVEVTTSSGHLLALGVDRLPPKGLPLRDTVERIRHMGGVAVPSHPLRVLTGVGPTDLREGAMTGHILAAEGRNGRDRPLLRENVLRLLEEAQLATTGGSDAHRPDEVGTCWTRFDGPLLKPRDVVLALRQGACRAEGGTIGRRRIWAHRALMAMGKA